MTRPSTDLSQLQYLIDDSRTFDESVYTSFKEGTISGKEKKKAMAQLKSKAESALLSLTGISDYLPSQKETYKGYCRDLAAYVLAFWGTAENFSDSFRVLFDLLQFVAPTYKHEIRSLKKQYKEEGAYVCELGYTWEELDSPFVVDRFANMFLKTTIAVKQKPQVVIKEVEKVVYVEKKIEIAVRETEDPDYFGKEGQTVEFKSSVITSCNSSPQILNICKAVCAFLNADGGVLYVGVDDYGRAIPKYMGDCLAGIHEDIAFLSKMNLLPYGKNSVDAYCLYVKREIINRFRDGNNVTKFDADIIVSETKNDNVIKIEVRKSKHCVVKLGGVAYRRSGASSPAMKEEQVERRLYELTSETVEVHYSSILNKAIDDKRQVILYGYASGNSGTISDRYVEPICFVCDGSSILCYDTVKQDTRQFKLSRIGDIRILDTPWQNEEQHRQFEADIFGWTNDGEWLSICLDMQVPARNFLLESLPNAKKNSFKSLGEGWYRLETHVHSLEPVRSFFLAYADCVEIRESECSDRLKAMIRDYVYEEVIPKVDLMK